MKKVSAIIALIVMALLLTVNVFAFWDINSFSTSGKTVGNHTVTGEQIPGYGSPNVFLYPIHLALNGDVLRTSTLLQLVDKLKTYNSEDLDLSNVINAGTLENSEILVIRDDSNDVHRNIYFLFNKGTVLSMDNAAAQAKVGIVGYSVLKDAIGWPIQTGYQSGVTVYGPSYKLNLKGMASNHWRVFYYTGQWSDGVSRNEGSLENDGSYVAPAFEFLCFNGDLPAPDGDGFLSVHTFPYLYYKIYSGSDDISKYSLRIYDDSMFSDENTLRAEISYEEMKGLEKDKTYTYVQSIHTYIPLAKDWKYWLQIYNRTTGQVVYELPVKTSGMTNQTPNIEHVHYWRVENGNTVGDPTAYNDTGYFGGEDIVGPYEPDLPPGASWENGGGNGGLPIDWTNLGELNDWFKTVGNYGSEFIGYLSSVFSFIPAAIWGLIGLAIAVAILMRVFGR